MPYITSARWGGFYSPLEQDPGRVLEDVKQGYVSLKCAEEKYGVVIDDKTMAVDEERTKEARLKSVRLFVPNVLMVGFREPINTCDISKAMLHLNLSAEAYHPCQRHQHG